MSGGPRGRRHLGAAPPVRGCGAGGMVFGAVVLGGAGALLGLAAAWFAAGSGAVAPRLVALAALSCLVGLLGLGLAARGRPRMGAALLAEAALGLAVALGGQHALVP